MKLISMTLTLLLVTLAGCADDGGSGEDAQTPSPEEERCQEACLQQLCDPLINLDPQEEPAVVCERFCEAQLEDAQDQACFPEYDALMSCLEPLSCEDFLAWRDQDADAACLNEEMTLSQACSSIEVPR